MSHDDFDDEHEVALQVFASTEEPTEKPVMLPHGERPTNLSRSGSGIMTPSFEVGYKLYKMRFAGCAALCLINIACAMNWVLFSAVAINTASHFQISLTRVNWLANIVCGMYVVVAPFVPSLVHRISIRGATFVAVIFLVVGVWIRYAATAHTFTTNYNGAYALLFVGSVLIGIAQCIVQVVPPAYSETWFGIKSRTTCTMLIAISNPFGGAIGQLIAPAIVTDPSKLPSLLLVVAIIASAIAPTALAVLRKPKTPPTRSAEAHELGQLEGGVLSALLVLFGLKRGPVTKREVIDFVIIAVCFATLVGFFDAFLTLTNQIFEPVGYDSDMSGYIGAAVIVSGLVAAIITAPLFDRYFQYSLAMAARILVPIIGISFFALIWAVKPHDLAGIFILAVLLGTSAFTMLPVALELGAEISWQVADPTLSSAVLYLLANGFSVVTVVAMGALQAGNDASPPGNMKKALIFEGVFVLVVSLSIFGLRGVQSRKTNDAKYTKESGGAKD